MWRVARAVLLLAMIGVLTSAVSAAASPPPRTTVGGVTFVPASTQVRRECRQTANAVHYPVPCPRLLPKGLKAFPAIHGCKLQIVGQGGGPHCSARWRGWIVGDGQVTSGSLLEEHLALQGAPHVVSSPARAIDGPGMVPGSHVRPRGKVGVAGKVMHWYFVPPATNEGSAYAGHLVLVWNADGHTYAYGFHVLETFAIARALDLELVRHLFTVRPRPSH
jgi:hypothetical protein